MAKIIDSSVHQTTQFWGIVPIVNRGDFNMKSTEECRVLPFPGGDGLAGLFGGPNGLPALSVQTESGVFGLFGGGVVDTDDALRWVQLFEEGGVRVLQNIDKPIWSFFWHSSRSEFIFAIDRYRIHSAHWMVRDGVLYFASSVRALLEISSESLKICPDALFSYIDTLCVPAELSIHKGAHKLSSGTFIHIKEGQLRESRYHDFSYLPKVSGDEGVLAEEIYHKLEQAVNRQLSWVPNGNVGCFLSGGTDSSALLGLCAQQRGRNFPAYTVTFSEDAWSEAEFAKLAADTFYADHKIIPFNMDDTWRISDQISSYVDEPMGNPSLLATFKCVEEAAGDGVNFLVAGDGGDEIFGGNDRYANDLIYSKYRSVVPFGIRKALMDTVGCLDGITGSGSIRRISNILKRANCPNPERYYLEDAFAYKHFPTAFQDRFSSNVDHRKCLKIFKKYYDNCDSHDELDKMLYVDMFHTLGDNDLVKVGASGRANNVCILYPMLDNELVKYACRLPVSAKIKGREKRYMYKKAMERLLPETILYKTKQGFGVPISYWLRNSDSFFGKFQEIVFDKNGLVLEIFDKNALSLLIKNHREGRVDLGMLLWGLYSLNLWADSAKKWGSQ